jgi:hypothetical protein
LVHRRALWLLAIALAVGAAGCGGSSSYTAADTRACLVARGVQVGGKLDFVASTATGGAFAARLGNNSVKLVFGETEKDAEQIQLAYENFAFPNVRPGLPDVLRRERNAVMLWQQHPEDADLSLVVGCLK